MDIRSTEGACNKNHAYTRVRGAAAFTTYTELAAVLQQRTVLEKQQKKKFAETFAPRIPLADLQTEQPLDDGSKCEAIWFHENWEYIDA